jgi:hypothetical protein
MSNILLRTGFRAVSTCRKRSVTPHFPTEARPNPGPAKLRSLPSTRRRDRVFFVVSADGKRAPNFRGIPFARRCLPPSGHLFGMFAAADTYMMLHQAAALIFSEVTSAGGPGQQAPWPHRVTRPPGQIYLLLRRGFSKISAPISGPRVDLCMRGSNSHRTLAAAQCLEYAG